MRGVWFNPDERESHDGIVLDATIRTFVELPDVLRTWRA
jgi:hypothetical protein